MKKDEIDISYPLFKYLNSDFAQVELGNELNEIDYFILTILSYTKFDLIKNKKLKKLTLLDYYYLLPSSDSHQVNRYLTLLRLAGKSIRYKKIKIVNYKYDFSALEEKQFAAITFLLPNKRRFISFRGTDTTLIGWKEDLNMAFLSEIPAEKEAYQYLLKEMKNHPLSKFYLGGHSKGGALAAYSYSKLSNKLDKRIIQVLDYDSPGLKDDNLSLEKLAKIKSYLPMDSIVGLIYHKKQKISVVSTFSKTRLMEHNPFYWDIIDDHFIHLKELDSGLMIEDHAINRVMMSLDEWERKLVIDLIYEAVKSEDPHYLITDVFNFKNLIRILGEYHALSKEEKMVMKNILKKIYLAMRNK